MSEEAPEEQRTPEEQRKTGLDARAYAMFHLKEVLEKRGVLAFSKPDGSTDYKICTSDLKSMKSYAELLKQNGSIQDLLNAYRIRAVELAVDVRDSSKLLPPKYLLLGVFIGGHSTYNVYLEEVDL